MEAGRDHELSRQVWEHIKRGEFAQAETALRSLIAATDPADSVRLWELYGLLAGVLNNLERLNEGTDAYREALGQARRAGDSHGLIGPARYMLANQLLLFGDPRDALAEAEPVPAGTGHVQCLLHCVAALALWKLERYDEARIAAQRAIDAAPTPERLSDMTRNLAHILDAV